MKHLLIDKNYGTYLSGMGFSMDEVLKKAMLPEDLLARQTPADFLRLSFSCKTKKPFLSE